MDDSGINNLNEAGWSQLMLAVENEDYHQVKALLDSGADVNLKGVEGQTALHIAVDVSLDTTYQMGLPETEAPVSILLLLMKYGADINSKDNKGKSPLDWAQEQRSTKIYDLLIENKP